LESFGEAGLPHGKGAASAAACGRPQSTGLVLLPFGGARGKCANLLRQTHSASEPKLSIGQLCVAQTAGSELVSGAKGPEWRRIVLPERASERERELFIGRGGAESKERNVEEQYWGK